MLADGACPIPPEDIKNKGAAHATIRVKAPRHRISDARLRGVGEE